MPKGCDRIGRRGFTLTEVIIALMVFAILTLIFASCIPVAHKTAKVNGQYSQAISLCQHKIDQLRAVGYGRLTYEELSDAGIIDEAPLFSPYSFVEVDQVGSYLSQPNATLSIQTIGTDQIKATATITWKRTMYEDKTSSASLSAIITKVE